MADTFVSPGAAFTGNFNQFMAQREVEKHQALLDDLAQKREARLAQAELDSAAERKAELARKTEADKQTQHDKAVADLEKRVGNMVKGDRPDPEMQAQAQALGLSSIFRQPAAPASTEVGAPPAALQVAPSPTATPEGGLPTPSGALSVQPPVYPGSVKERQKEADEAKQKAFIDSMPEGDPRKDELRQAMAAEAVGLKVPPGYFSKSASAAKHRVIFDPISKTYIDGVTHKPITDESDLENAQVDRSAEPKDNSAGEDRRAARFDRIRQHAYDEFKDASKPLLDRIDRADKLETSLNQHTDVADSTIAEQLVTLTAGGAGSGVRISQPMIDQVLSKSRNKWDDFSQALKRWDASPKDPKNIGLFFTPDQRKGISDLGRAYREEAVKQRKKVLDYRRQIDESPDDAKVINRIRTRAQEDLLEPPTESAPVAKPKRTAAEILAGI